MDRPERRTRTKVAQMYGAVLFAVYGAILWMHRVPPLLGDFSDWIYEGALLARHMRGLPDPAHLLKHYPVPNSTETVLLGLLMCVLPWAIVAKVFLCAQLAVEWLAIRSLARATGASAWIWFIAPGAFFLGLNFWYGFGDFSLGIAFLVFFLASLLRFRDERAPMWPMQLWLLLLFFTHMVPFTFACLTLACFCVQMRRPRPLGLVMAPAGLLAWYAAARFAAGNMDSAAAPAVTARWMGLQFWAYKVNTLVKSFGLVNPVANGHSEAVARLHRGGFLACVAVTVLLCVALVVLCWRSCGRKPQDSFFWAAAGIAMAAYLLVPASLLGLSDPGARILQAALCPALFFCTDSSRLWRLMAACSVLLSIPGLLLFATVPWTLPTTGTSHRAPVPMEQLAGAHYAHGARYISDLEQGNWTEAVFPTGVFRNGPQQVR